MLAIEGLGFCCVVLAVSCVAGIASMTVVFTYHRMCHIFIVAITLLLMSLSSLLAVAVVAAQFVSWIVVGGGKMWMHLVANVSVVIVVASIGS